LTHKLCGGIVLHNLLLFFIFLFPASPPVGM
jgi:hypothetical protein